MAVRCAVVILGMSMPFKVLFTSSKALVLAVLPSVLIAKDCAWDWYPYIVINITESVCLNFMVNGFTKNKT